MLEYLFHKVERPAALLKRDFNTGVFCEIYKVFKNNYFKKYLRTTAFEFSFILRLY